MKWDDQRIYKTFEEFEREELRRADGLGGSMDDLIDSMFAEELDFGSKSSRRDDAEDEE
jgi:hypothetical protein